MFKNTLKKFGYSSFTDLHLAPVIKEELSKDGYNILIDYLLEMYQQWDTHKEDLSKNLLRQTATGEHLKDYLDADQLNFSGVPEEIRGKLNIAFRGIYFKKFTWESFNSLIILLADIGYSLLPVGTDIHAYSLLKQSLDSAKTARQIAQFLTPRDGRVKTFVNITEGKEITLIAGFKTIGETVIPVVFDNRYPWVRQTPDITFDPITSFGFGFFKDLKTTEKNIWIGHFEGGARHSSLVSENGVNWIPYAENEVDNQLVGSGYTDFANVPFQEGDIISPLMIGGHLRSTTTSEIYIRKQEYSGLGSNYTYDVFHTGEFTPRRSLGATWFKDELWVIGGLGGDNADSVDIWKSPMKDNDKAFILVNDTPPWSFIDDTDKDVYGHCLVTFKDKMWFLGGRKTTGKHYNNVYSSSDGLTWAKSVPPWKERAYFGAVVISNRLYIFGGEFSDNASLNTTTFNDVWYTEDGETWISDGVGEFHPRSRFGYLADEDKNKIYLFGGQDANGLKYNDVIIHDIII